MTKLEISAAVAGFIVGAGLVSLVMTIFTSTITGVVVGLALFIISLFYFFLTLGGWFND